MADQARAGLNASPPKIEAHNVLEGFVAKIIDPGVDLKKKHAVAVELRETIESVRDTEYVKILPKMIPMFLEILRKGQPSFNKESLEYQFRHELLEMLHKLPYQHVDVLRPLVLPLFQGMLHTLRTDNEDSGAICCKTILDLVRNFKSLNEELARELTDIFRDLLKNMPPLITQFFSESSPEVDPHVVLPSIGSFNIIMELANVVVTFIKMYKPIVLPLVSQMYANSLEFLALESPIQSKARTDYEAMGSHWYGMAPEMKNAPAYVQFLESQIKIVSTFAFATNTNKDANLQQYHEQLFLATLRIMQDCPAYAGTPRKDALTVFRHLGTVIPRKTVLAQMDKIVDEKVLLGEGVGTRELLRLPAYDALNEMIILVRYELSVTQVEQVILLSSKLLHDPYLPLRSQLAQVKTLTNMVDALAPKNPQQPSPFREDQPTAVRLLTAVFKTCVERLDALHVVEEVRGRAERTKKNIEEPVGFSFIERSRPVAGAAYAVEKPEEAIAWSRFLFRGLLGVFKGCIHLFAQLNAPAPDGSIIGPMFEGCIRCFQLFDMQAQEATEYMEWFARSMYDVDLHVLQEVWTMKIDFFFQAAQQRTWLLNICVLLFQTEHTSPTILAIALRYLVDRMPLLGDEEDHVAVATIRFYKMAFQAVAYHTVANEPILAAHLSKIIMDCFPLAAKAQKPLNYFHLLRSLFRAIGGGGGKFELLYKEVLPLLPEMLESLSRQLVHAEGIARDMIVELCLTVPLRLTHLLPHLSYLMRPLALALRGSPELVSQGLRTLELCIDNLTPDFLDPTLSTVLRELMEALHSHLKPVPANHHHAHTTIRILGKLGGRNRRLLTKDPSFIYYENTDPALLPLSFGREQFEEVNLEPMSILAVKTLGSKLMSPYHLDAYKCVESCISIVLQTGITGREHEALFTRSIEGAFSALHLPETTEQAEKLIQDVARHVLETEVKVPSGPGQQPSVLLRTFLDALPHAMSRENPQDAAKARTVLENMVHSVGAMYGTEGVNVRFTLYQWTLRLAALCLDPSWTRKSAACQGIRMMTEMAPAGVEVIRAHDSEIIRTLLHVLKDLPHDLPRNVGDVTDVLTGIFRVSYPASLKPELESTEPTQARQKLDYHVAVLTTEFLCANPIVRQASQTCMTLLAELSGKTIPSLLASHRTRLMSSLYTKPLRALPFVNQIGIIEATRYLLSFDPPLTDVGDEFFRLLTETLAFADSEDLNLVSRGNPRQDAVHIKNLRVASLKLLTASMNVTDFFSNHATTRERVTSVYFKSLYSPYPEVKEVAHDGLKMVLRHQSRLPKGLLQTGLRPILMNLADPKRLSVAGLEGLARLLALLTNYFKVEIGHKLLDHYRFVAEPGMLVAAARLPLPENEGITKLVSLSNIFHLLPSEAHIFLDTLVNIIVQTEEKLHFSAPSPFSPPLAKYLDRYPVHSVDFFFNHLASPRHVRTFRSIIQGNEAKALLSELVSRTPHIVKTFVEGEDSALILPALQLFKDVTEVHPTWILENEFVLTALLQLWRSEVTKMSPGGLDPNVMERNALILGIFKKALETSPRIDLLFDITLLFDHVLPVDPISPAQFLYQHVAMSEDLIYRRNVLTRFLTWFGNPAHSWSQKSHVLRFIITPTLLIHASRPGLREGLLDMEFVKRIHRDVWQSLIYTDAFASSDDTFKIEMLYLTTVIVHHYPAMVNDAKKDIIKCAWHHIGSEDLIVKQTAYLLAARFLEAFPSTPQKFVLKAWTGLLRATTLHVPNTRQALDILVPVLQAVDPAEAEAPAWAKTTRRLMIEDANGFNQSIAVFQLVIRQPKLFAPVRSLFVPHMVKSLGKLGLLAVNTSDSRNLSLDILQTVFNWEQEEEKQMTNTNQWTTPVALREDMVSYLVRLAVLDGMSKVTVAPRAIVLLKSMLGADGWNNVTLQLNFFTPSLESDLVTKENVGQALAAARVLQVLASDKPDQWYTDNEVILQKLIQKGLLVDEPELHEALRGIFGRLLTLFPLPKEEMTDTTNLSEFHRFIHASLGEALPTTNGLRGPLLMLKMIVKMDASRVETFTVNLMKLLSKFIKDLVTTPPNNNPNAYDANGRQIVSCLEIFITAVAHLGDTRRWLLSTLVVLLEKTKSMVIFRYLLGVARKWALQSEGESYPNMKEKATLLQKMAIFEMRGNESRDPVLFHNYLELIYEIYTSPALRRSELTTRLEVPFLLGCRARDPVLREKFISLLDSNLPRALPQRLAYVLGASTWEALSEHNWIPLALNILLGAVDGNYPLVAPASISVNAPSEVALSRPSAYNFIGPAQRLAYVDISAAHATWVSIFPAAWSCLGKREQADVTQYMITLLSKEYHIRHTDMRQNVIQTLLTGVNACSPPMILPPHLVKYLAKTYGAWHVGLEILAASLDIVRDDDQLVRDSVYDSLADVYAEIAEEDLFYGLWRRRSLHPETNMAIAFEQHGMWEQASITYENALNKTRAGTLAYSEPEYCLWEDHWMLSAEKLNQWDLLHDLGRNESNTELLLEAAWRTKDWAENLPTLEEQIRLLPEIATPRRKVFEAFIALLNKPAAASDNTQFTKILEDAMQLSLRKWVALPPNLSAAHVPLLQHFQQFVELQEAVQIFGSLQTTTAQNLEKKSAELKMVLQAWRERLPNMYDDISIWSDLVAWRQNVFLAINKAYIPLTPAQGGGATSNSTNTSGFRGYHETAWIINRFAHVARKHDLLDVCFGSLNKIYTLPNIEISEAFLKLREQARCYYQKPNDLQAGLEVINNTNLMYFSTAQKAEFFTLKGMFHARFGRSEEANMAFGQAVQLDMSQARAWAEWGKFSDRAFKEDDRNMQHAASAVSCYLQAAGQYKSGKSRPLFVRVLWLLSVDNDSHVISRAFDTYKGEACFWYWVTLVPQLCISIGHREFKQARYILLNLAKLYPQASFYHLRGVREEAYMKKRNAQRQKDAQRASENRPGPDVEMADATKPGPPRAPSTVDGGPPRPPSDPNQPLPRPAQEGIDEIMNILKTAFPLLTLSMESMLEQMTKYLRSSSPDEEVCRIISVMLQDAVSTVGQRAHTGEIEGYVPDKQIAYLKGLTANLSESIRAAFDADFVAVPNPNFPQFVARLQEWRDRVETTLSLRPRFMTLENVSRFLSEFQYGKFDEVEIPGQYTEDKENNQNFVKIQKFGPKVEGCRTHGIPWRRLSVHGNDNSTTTFAVQSPPTRFSRKDERAMQLFRTFNLVLGRKKETLKRNLTFHVPASIQCGVNLRLLVMDASYVNMGDIYERHCAKSGFAREEPCLMAGARYSKFVHDYRRANPADAIRGPPAPVRTAFRKEVFDEVVAKLVPEDIITKYMTLTMDGPAELWRMRKQFALQIAATSFMTYLLSLTQRNPYRFHISRGTGCILMTELVPGMTPMSPEFASPESVPFRLTPNMQHFMGPLLTEGVLTSGLMAMARCLTDPEYDLEQQLCLYSRDEVLYWMENRHPQAAPWTVSLKDSVKLNIAGIVARAETMSCKLEREQATTPNAEKNLGTVPVIQTVTNLISMATNPVTLSMLGDQHLPFF